MCYFDCPLAGVDVVFGPRWPSLVVDGSRTRSHTSLGRLAFALIRECGTQASLRIPVVFPMQNTSPSPRPSVIDSMIQHTSLIQPDTETETERNNMSRRSNDDGGRVVASRLASPRPRAEAIIDPSVFKEIHKTTMLSSNLTIPAHNLSGFHRPHARCATPRPPPRFSVSWSPSSAASLYSGIYGALIGAGA
jgi:hypothetical protein